MNSTNPDIRKGGIYAFVSPQFGSWSAHGPSGHLLNQGMITLKANIVQAEKDGQAVFRVESDTQPYRLLSSADAQQKALQPHLNRISVWTANDPAPALLLELSCKFGPDAYKVLPPGSWKREQRRWGGAGLLTPQSASLTAPLRREPCGTLFSAPF